MIIIVVIVIILVSVIVVNTFGPIKAKQSSYFTGLLAKKGEGHEEHLSFSFLMLLLINTVK